MTNIDQRYHSHHLRHLFFTELCKRQKDNTDCSFFLLLFHITLSAYPVRLRLHLGADLGESTIRGFLRYIAHHTQAPCFRSQPRYCIVSNAAMGVLILLAQYSWVSFVVDLRHHSSAWQWVNSMSRTG